MAHEGDKDLPPDVVRIKQLLAMYLLSLPEDERQDAMLDLTKIMAAATEPK